MAFKVSTLKIRQQLGDILNRVFLRHDEFIVERKGRSLAALVPVEKIQQMQIAARLHLLQVLEKSKSSEPSQEKADELANEAKHESRKKS
ncbi:MAG: hypothetical protein A2Z91_07670 [Deltaproteobacteria bacterium GWA2_38_16]|nr:MAG: hypothetical protein A2Z91_07670 [Deltaproteobacteria bacterium GWA2_38_16]OGQ03078.1 MAG: hypothetical protein A3D19_03400 [Deltaproteobacteria bacterium RIFCSPHIGHO2_02_FULL_38_15]OGQ34976.1 MAG: hypothetical protein A3A72_07790 [Deltaproteobacteria bacterium RIFCSPLOWO2_01_FULL_38_9]OGQ63356.1 MAG: hypothetical protein A3G92_01340 [Deltaproteobacteria bacterium RIFCSPLOWO2_12_FULL_38_8]HBQ20505.1 hypothetical protein [Deltaproteobacteria bacterium]